MQKFKMCISHSFSILVLKEKKNIYIKKRLTAYLKNIKLCSVHLGPLKRRNINNINYIQMKDFRLNKYKN